MSDQCCHADGGTNDAAELGEVPGAGARIEKPANDADSGEWVPEHQAVHRRLCEYARHRSALEAAEAFDLVRAEQFKLYAFYACSTHYEYMERILGYGPHAARERMRVARALVRLPETTAALVRGELNYSAVRELTRVVTDETEGAWLARAKGLVVNQVEKLVAHHQPGDLPDDPTSPNLKPRVVRFELPPEVYALWRQARMVLAEERGSDLRDADVLETMCRAIIAPGTGVSGPAHQIAYQQCPDCRRAVQNGAGRPIGVASEVFERASCDAKVLGSLDASAPERATTTVTPRIREQVFARDYHRCTVPGCRSARNLDVHHIVYQSHGGGHDLSNLTLICSGHHAALHAGLLTVKGEAPYLVEFRWTFGAPTPLGLDPAARSALIAQQIDQIFEHLERNHAAGRNDTDVQAGRRPQGEAAHRSAFRETSRASPPDSLPCGTLRDASQGSAARGTSNETQRASVPRGTSSERTQRDSVPRGTSREESQPDSVSRETSSEARRESVPCGTWHET